MCKKRSHLYIKEPRLDNVYCLIYVLPSKLRGRSLKQIEVSLVDFLSKIPRLQRAAVLCKR